MSKVRMRKALIICISVVAVVTLISSCMCVYIVSNLRLKSISIEAPEHLRLSESRSVVIYTYYENNSIFPDNIVSLFKKIKKRLLDISVNNMSDCIVISEKPTYLENNEIVYEVVGISDGECNIDISVDGIQKSVKIASGTCDPQRIEAIKKVFVDVDGTTSQKITTKVYPTYADNTVYFEIENEDIATIAEDGDITAKKSGETIVYAKTPNGCVAKTYVICAKFAEQFKLKTTEMHQRMGTKFTIGYEIVPSDVTYYSDVIWEVENENIVKQTGQGVFQALNPGTTRIIANFTSSKQFRAICTIIVF